MNATAFARAKPAAGGPACGDPDAGGAAACRAASRDAFIAAMRRVAASVTVVTTDGPAGRHGATVSAFCSVSADPPTVLVCLRAESRIARAVVANGAFTVSVLPEHGAEIARRFAGAFDAEGHDRFAAVPLTRLDGSGPGIAGATALGCRLAQSVHAATHVMCVGTVQTVVDGSPSPLAYLNGAFCRVFPAPEAVAS